MVNPYSVAVLVIAAIVGVCIIPSAPLSGLLITAMVVTALYASLKSDD
jgi:hypothetical protein